MNEFYVLERGDAPCYYCGWFHDGTPAETTAIVNAAMWQTKEAAEAVLIEVGHDFKVMEHGF